MPLDWTQIGAVIASVLAASSGYMAAARNMKSDAREATRMATTTLHTLIDELQEQLKDLRLENKELRDRVAVAEERQRSIEVETYEDRNRLRAENEQLRVEQGKLRFALGEAYQYFIAVREGRDVPFPESLKAWKDIV